MNLNYIMFSKEEICVKFDRGRDLYEIFIILKINLVVYSIKKDIYIYIYIYIY